jgi:hypothetical protein
MEKYIGILPSFFDKPAISCPDACTDPGGDLSVAVPGRAKKFLRIIYVR